MKKSRKEYYRKYHQTAKSRATRRKYYLTKIRPKLVKAGILKPIICEK